MDCSRHLRISPAVRHTRQYTGFGPKGCKACPGSSRHLSLLWVRHRLHHACCNQLHHHHQASATTKRTLEAITQLLDYAATYPEAIICFNASDMVLYVESNASFFSETKACSRVAGYHYLSAAPAAPLKAPMPDASPPPLNGPINVPCKILRKVLSSAAEAELGDLCYNGKEAVPERITLEELGHKQPPTPMVTDNTTATSITNDCIKQKCSKTMDMRFYWIQDRVRQGQFIVYWKRGKSNRADYFTKHHPVKHHQQERPEYVDVVRTTY
jgi:hypothetical protein